MDDELQQLEAELKRLEPIGPSRALSARVEAALSPSTERLERTGSPRPHWMWAAVLLPAAAATALMIVNERGLQTNRASLATPPVSGTQAGLKPVTAENVLVAAQDEGLVTLDDGTPARRARLKYVDTFTWRDPRTNASLIWTVPREEVRVVPVSFQ